MEKESKPVVVLDHGTLTTRAGLSNSENPLLLPTRTKSLINPISAGVIKDFSAMEDLWQDTFNAIGINAKDHRVMITEPLCNYEKNRQNITEIMFESFNVPGFYLASAPVLALFNSGRTTGIVYTSGSTFGTTYAVPIYEGHVVPFCCGRMPIGGDTFDDTLKSLLAERYSFMQHVDYSIIRKIKESACYVAQDYAKELASHSVVKHTLPDGQVIQLGEERFRCAEGLFNPAIMHVESQGVHKIIYDTIINSDESIRKKLFANIVLDGGASMFSGIAERLKREMEMLMPSLQIKVYASPLRTEAVWRGGTLLANLSTFDKWITRKEYDESGSKVLHLKCF